MTDSGERFLNLALRILALGSRFLFFMVLAIFLPPEQVGLFGLVAVTVGYSVFFLGLDFYVFANRELRIAEPEERSGILKHSLALYAVVYAVILPLLLLIFVTELLPWNMVFLFFLILVFEHLSQETYRLLVVLGRPLLASISLFLRLGLWAIIVSGLMALDPMFRTLEAALVAWAIGSGTAVILGAWVIVGLPRDGWKHPIDWAWIRGGLKTAFAFLAATLALRGIITIDRFWLEALTSTEILGTYVFFMGMASTLPAILEAGVFAFIFPKLLTAWHQQDHAGYAALFRRLMRETTIVVFGFSFIAVVGIQLVIPFLNNPIYSDNIIFFYFSLAAMAANGLSMIFHFGLYSKRMDKPIIASHFFGIAVFIGATPLFALYSELLAVPFSVALAYLGILSLKAILFWVMPANAAT